MGKSDGFLPIPRYNTLVVNVLYRFLVGLRWLFLSCRLGAFLHNLFYYIVWSLSFPSAHDRRLMTALLTSLSVNNQSTYEWQRKIYTSAPKVWQHYLRSSFILKRFIGFFRRRRLQKAGHVVPSLLMVSPSSPGSGCNLSCAHCYANAHADATLPIDVFRKLLIEQEELGIFAVMVSGGEPLMYEGMLDLFQEFPDTSFQVFTNGTLVTEEIAEILADLGNAVLTFSIEGFEEETDRIRGQGVFGKVLNAVEYCRKERLVYGATITVTRNNFAEVVSERFMKFLEGLGCAYVNFSTYIAVGQSPHHDWEISANQAEQLDLFKENARLKYAMITTVGKNGTAGVTGCFAGRQYLHILPNGMAEGCPFVHLADPTLNIQTNSILELTGSPLFQRLRELTALMVPGVVPCRASRYDKMAQFIAEVAISTEGGTN